MLNKLTISAAAATLLLAAPQPFAAASSCSLPEDTPLDCSAFVGQQDFPHDQQGNPIFNNEMDEVGYADACYAAADKQLNAMYKSMNAFIDASVGDFPPLSKDDAATWKKHLRDAQRGWIQFKENECEMEWFRLRDASIRLSAGSTCSANLTVNRLDGWRSEYPEAWANVCSR